jgi:ATP-dependent helicase/nuclease subunit A
MSSPSSDVIRYYHTEKGQDEWVIIQAGAGAGKTTELVSRVLSFGIEFQKKHHRYPKIVVTTFTIKATQELKERLLKTSAKISQEISKAQALELQAWLLSSQVNITTIHSAVLRFLREKGSEIGLSSDFQVIEEPIKYLSKFVKKKIFNSQDVQLRMLPFYKHFSFSELLDILHAGFNYKLAHGILNSYQCGFDKEFWHQNVKTLQKDLSENLSSLGSEQLKTASQKRAYASYQVLISKKFQTPEQLSQFFEEHSLTGSNKFGRGEPDLFMIECLKKLKTFKEDIWNFSSLEESQSLSELMLSVIDDFFEDWISFVLENQKIALSDIENWGLYLARKFPDSADDYSDQWDYWYVDEYQDTSPNQVKLLDFLMGPKKGFFVGDPQQSIYLFRGSRPHVFKERSNRISNDQGKSLFLKKNYRTVEAVLNFINRFTQEIKSQSFLEMEIGKSKDLKGSVKIKRYKVGNSFKPESWIGKVCSDYIQELKAKKPDLNYNQVCILAPRTKELIWICKELDNQGIPYQLHSGGSYFNRREILDCIQLLRFILAPDDDLNLVGILNSEYSEVTTEEIFKLKKNPDQSLWSQLKQEFRSFTITGHLLEILDLCQIKGVYWALFFGIQKLGVISYYRCFDATGISEANIWKLLSDISELQNQVGFDWQQFYWDLMDKMDSDPEEKDSVSDAESNRVQLMTIHASKGLEFQHVILPYFDRRKNNYREGRFLIDENQNQLLIKNSISLPPQAKTIQKQIDLLEMEEKDRLWYVGMTRSIESLFIPYAQKQDEKELSPMIQILNKFDTEDPELFDCEVDQIQEISTLNKVRLRTRPVTSDLKKDFSSTLREFTSWDLFQRQVQGIDLHARLEKIVLTKLDIVQDPHLSWIQESHKKWAQRIPNGLPEWGYTIKRDQIVSKRIDLWGYDENENLNWILDYKSGVNVNLEQAWVQLESYAMDLKQMRKLVDDRPLELAIVLLHSKQILERQLWIN